MNVKNKKSFKIFNYILGVLFIICVYSAFKPFKYPLEQFSFRQDGGNIGSITEDTVIKNKYVSECDKLDTIRIITATFGKKIESGTLTVSIYDKDKIIYKNKYNLAEFEDSEYLKFEFDVQKNSLGKEYIVELDIKDLGENDVLSFYGNDDVEKISTSNQNIKLEASLLMNIHGEFPSYIYTTILFLILLILLFINVYKNLDINFKIAKLKYILLIIVSLVMALGMFIVYSAIIYNLNLSPFIIIITMLAMILVIINLAIEFSKKDKKMEELFLALAIPLGAIFLILVVPGSGPDESFHFKMVHRLANLSFANSNYSFPYSGTVEYGNYREAILAILKKEEVPGSGLFYGNGYAFLLYIVPAIGFKLTSILNSSMLLNMYGGSFFNYIFYLISGFFIIKKMPSFKYLMLFYLLTPLYLQQATSLSCDAMIFPSCLYFIACILDIKVNKKELNIKTFIMLNIISIFIFVSKFAYFPILILYILIKKQIKEFMKKHKKIFISTLLITIISMCLLTYLYKIRPLNEPIENIEYEEKIPTVLQNKFIYTLSSINKIPAVAIKTIKIDGVAYLTDFSGSSLKWDEVILPAIVPIVFYIILFMLIFFDEDKIKYDKKTKRILLVVFIINALVVFAGLYTDGALRSLYVEGVQGRYFIPFAILLLMILKGKFIKLNLTTGQKKIILMSAVLFINIIAIKYLMISYMG